MSKNNIINNENKKIIELMYSSEMIVEINASMDSMWLYQSLLDSKSFDIDDLFISAILRQDNNDKKIIINQYEHVIRFLLMLEQDGIFDWKIVIFDNYKGNDAIKIMYAIYAFVAEKLIVLFFDFDEVFTRATERIRLPWGELGEIDNRLSLLSEKMSLHEVDDFIMGARSSMGNILTEFNYLYKEYGVIIDIIKRVRECCENKAKLVQIKIDKHMLIH